MSLGLGAWRMQLAALWLHFKAVTQHFAPALQNFPTLGSFSHFLPAIHSLNGKLVENLGKEVV